MHEHAADPVVIFLPVPRREVGPDEVVVDPVCGRALAMKTAAGRLRHDDRHHYFCSLECAERFAARPEEYQPR